MEKPAVPVERVRVDEPVVRAPAPAHAAVLVSATPPKVDASQRPQGASMRVLLEGLALRGEPRVDSPVIAHLGKGAIVELGHQAVPPNTVGDWRQVSLGELRGWVAAQWLVPTRGQVSAAPTQGHQAMKAQAGKSIGQAPQPAPSRQLGLQEARPTGSFKVVLPHLAIRVAPDVNALILGRVPEGTVLRALDMPASSGWTPVMNGPVRGWVATQWLQAVPPGAAQ